ncbi:hypothetical protein SAMN02745181_1870 [Rubritalea squalenifaciens DSM 18772]|uniref:Uncharacterized protein n=1 Tax=Rubritalea squalenifaciens DSM 18772 TaxID=1123071 RepID=A0A1M6INF8_9BACT|nr:hypothetical protein [Rubritalea squalenifaciens]SHJ36001.1 hypothetical protein SAMN02745181_1870 [Rubritalea squalenifaciens DSM 18772]
MKIKYTVTTLLAIGLPLLSSCNDKNAEAKGGHEGHDHASHEGHDHGSHDGHDHGDHEGHDHGSHEGHDHAVAGPNNGRMIKESQAEFLVTDSRNVQITFFNESNEAQSPEGKTVLVLTGDRSNPVEMTFKVNGIHLVSEQTIPEGNNFPTAVEINLGGGKKFEDKFTLNLSDCPTCDNKEYACECHH